MLVLVSLCFIFSIYFGYNIDCKHGCSGTYKCRNNEDCYIICNTTNACKDTTFVCSNNNNCYIDCINNNNDDSPCLGTIFDGEYANSVHININTNNYNNVWSFGTVKCPINGDCNINCNGIYTNNGGVCQHNTIYGLNAKSVNIYGNGNYPIWDFDIYCPMVKNGICNIIVNNGTGLMDDVAIYSKQGFRNVNIFCDHSFKDKCYSKTHLPMLFCEHSECTIESHNNNQWFCSDLTNKCNKNPVTSNKIYDDDTEVIVFKHSNLEILQTQIGFWFLIVTLICLLIICCVITRIIVKNIKDSLGIDTLSSLPKAFANNFEDDTTSIESITTTKTYDDINNNNPIKFDPAYKNCGVIQDPSSILNSQNNIHQLQPQLLHHNINDFNNDIHIEPSMDDMRGEYSIFISSSQTDSSFPSIPKVPKLPIERHGNIYRMNHQ